MSAGAGETTDGGVRFRELSAEVLVAAGPIVEIGAADVDDLKRRALASPLGRARICAHPDVDDRLHEMLVVHRGGAYVRPHRHLGKSESLQVLEGVADVVFLDELGEVNRVVPLAAPDAGGGFYFRIDGPVYHTMLIRSEFLVCHEVTLGPFRREDTVFPPWAPADADGAARTAFQRRLEEAVARLSGDVLPHA